MTKLELIIEGIKNRYETFGKTYEDLQEIIKGQAKIKYAVDVGSRIGSLSFDELLEMDKLLDKRIEGRKLVEESKQVEKSEQVEEPKQVEETEPVGLIPSTNLTQNKPSQSVKSYKKGKSKNFHDF